MNTITVNQLSVTGSAPQLGPTSCSAALYGTAVRRLNPLFILSK